jgi:hypothetical protein
VFAYATATSYGVIDHCTFTKTSSTATAQGVAVGGDQDAAWNRDLGLGQNRKLMIDRAQFKGTRSFIRVSFFVARNLAGRNR